MVPILNAIIGTYGKNLTSSLGEIRHAFPLDQALVVGILADTKSWHERIGFDSLGYENVIIICRN